MKSAHDQNDEGRTGVHVDSKKRIKLLKGDDGSADDSDIATPRLESLYNKLSIEVL